MTVENYEPLGQRLYPNDPEDYEPPTGSFGLNNADYPEWMCEEATAALFSSFLLPWLTHSTANATVFDDSGGPYRMLSPC